MFFITLSTRSLEIPSSQVDSIIFHNKNFLQLKGVLLTHPPLSWSKERAHTIFHNGTSKQSLLDNYKPMEERAQHGYIAAKKRGGKEGAIIKHKILLSLQSRKGVA